METVWRFRIMFVMAVSVLIFGDFLGYGNGRGDKHQMTRRPPTALREKHPEISLEDDTSIGDLDLVSSRTEDEIHDSKKSMRLSDSLREACLPKILCEMAAKPITILNNRERTLLDLISTTTLSLTWYSAPSRWHFAAHIGQLMRYSGDAMGGPMGCSELWPQCPYSSKRLLQLSSKVVLK